MFTCRDRTYAYRTEGPVVLVSSTLPVSSLPAAVRRLDLLPVGPLPRSALVDAVTHLMASLAGHLEESWTFDSEYAARGLIDLETAILTEVLGPREPLVGTDRLHAAAVEYIEQHLADPDLRPPQIADALGVSLRYLHRAFDDEEVTVARHLRERRLDLVAEALRTASRPPSLAALAERYGFSSQDGLARAFRRRFGRSMTDFRAELDD
jgi:AraC-like DNA-binding protein